jgi:signal transduction histidine kinase
MPRLQTKHRLAEFQERTRIARELHDTLLQAFTAATLLMQGVADDLRVVSTPETAAAVRTLDGVIGLTGSALTDTRRAVWNLRDPLQSGPDIAVRLESMLYQILGLAEVRFELNSCGASRRLGHNAEDQTVQICREAVWNIVRHARAQRVTVTVAYGHECLGVTITDDGRGFSVDPHFDPASGHFGLIGLHERATQAGGKLAIQSTIGQGTTIVLTIPYAPTPGGAVLRVPS